MQRVLVAVLAGCASILIIACGGGSTSNATPRTAATAGSTSAIAPPIPPTPNFVTPTPPVQSPLVAPTAVRIDPAPGERLPNPAPIREATVRPAPSGSRYTLHLVAGLFGACAVKGTQEVSRDGAVINVTVINLLAPSITCQVPESTYELDIDLPGAFVSGMEYTVNVNGKVVTFTP